MCTIDKIEKKKPTIVTLKWKQKNPFKFKAL